MNGMREIIDPLPSLLQLRPHCFDFRGVGVIRQDGKQHADEKPG